MLQAGISIHKTESLKITISLDKELYTNYLFLKIETPQGQDTICISAPSIEIIKEGI